MKDRQQLQYSKPHKDWDRQPILRMQSTLLRPRTDRQTDSRAFVRERNTESASNDVALFAVAEK